MAKQEKPNNKNKRKDIIIKLISIILIFIVIFIMYKLINSLQTIKIPKEYELYQYVMGKKVYYSGIIEISSKGNITKLTTKEGNIYLESAPVYYKTETNKAILPSEMIVSFPMDGGVLNKINSLSTLYIKYGEVFVKNEDLDKNLIDAFLYDGNDLYVFVENTVVNVDGNEYKLPPLSYVNATYKGYVEIYNYDTEEYLYIEDVKDNIIASTSKYKINLSNDSMEYENTEQLLLKRIKNLPNLK